MAILLAGGLGKTALRIAQLLQQKDVPFLLTSRTPSSAPASYPCIKFDWLDSSTWEGALSASPDPVTAIYVVGLPLDVMQPFIDLACSKGVKRFVVLTASEIETSDQGRGKIQRYLIDQGLEWAALRPTWFIENFVTWWKQPIIAESKIYSGTDTGAVPWISADDIAAVAVEALTAEKSYNADPVLIGRELFSFDEAAALLSEILGRKITHVKISQEALTKRWQDTAGTDLEGAKFMASLDLAIDRGSESRWAKEPGVMVDEWSTHRDAKVLLGKKTMRAIFEENKNAWQI